MLFGRGQIGKIRDWQGTSSSNDKIMHITYEQNFSICKFSLSFVIGDAFPDVAAAAGAAGEEVAANATGNANNEEAPPSGSASSSRSKEPKEAESKEVGEILSLI